MVSVLIFCHDKREGAFWGKLCKEYLKFIKEEFVYSFIGDMDYDESYIRGVQSPELIIAEISGLEDLEKVKYTGVLCSSGNFTGYAAFKTICIFKSCKDDS